MARESHPATSSVDSGSCRDGTRIGAFKAVGANLRAKPTEFYRRKGAVNLVPQFPGKDRNSILTPCKANGVTDLVGHARSGRSLHGARKSRRRISCRVGTAVRGRYTGAAVRAT